MASPVVPVDINGKLIAHHGTIGDEQIKADTVLTATRLINDFSLDLARKHVDGKRAFFFFGRNPTVGTTYEDIVPFGGDITWLTAGTIIEVLSSNAADTSAGTGARSVEIHGLGIGGEDQEEIIDMNGTDAVQSVLKYTRVNRIHLQEVGTYGGAHEGDITLRVTGAGATLALMTGDEGAVNVSAQYGAGEGFGGHYSVPLGKVLYVSGITISVTAGANKTVDIHLYEREGIHIASAPFEPRRSLRFVTDVEGKLEIRYKSYIKIKQLTDIWFRAKVNSGTAAVDVTLEHYLVDRNEDGA